jgi:hypothetical protein
MTRFSG